MLGALLGDAGYMQGYLRGWWLAPSPQDTLSQARGRYRKGLQMFHTRWMPLYSESV